MSSCIKINCQLRMENFTLYKLKCLTTCTFTLIGNEGSVSNHARSWADTLWNDLLSYLLHGKNWNPSHKSWDLYFLSERAQ